MTDHAWSIQNPSLSMCKTRREQGTATLSGWKSRRARYGAMSSISSGVMVPAFGSDARLSTSLASPRSCRFARHNISELTKSTAFLIYASSWHALTCDDTCARVSKVYHPHEYRRHDVRMCPFVKSCWYHSVPIDGLVCTQ